MAQWKQRKPIKKPLPNATIVENIARIRGIDNIEDWMNPPSKYLNSPYELENIDEVVQRIIKAVHMGERIGVFADCDLDGICSGAIMFNYLKNFVEEERLEMLHAQRSISHGLEKIIPEWTDKIHDNVKYVHNGIDLLIVVDSSANSLEACKFVKEEYGMDIVIIDHHEVEIDDNPYAIMTNCQMGKYPNKYLSGSGMAWKTCQVLDDYMGVELSDDFIDLSAIGLIGDMMDVSVQENRRIIYQGLSNITNIGLFFLLQEAKVDVSKDIDTTSISFSVAPAISACSRFDKIELALELMTTEDENRAKELAKSLVKLNEVRKNEQKEMVEPIIEKVDNSNKIVIAIDNQIDSGFRGLVSTELTQKFGKPSFVVTEIHEDGKLVRYRGSARGLGKIDLKKMCNDSKLFNFATGHAQSFGLEFDAENIDKIVEYFNSKIDEKSLQKDILYDLEVDINDVDIIDIKEIEKFSRIVGQKFPEPKFKINGVVIEEGYNKKLGNYCRAILGKQSNTIKLHSENDFVLMKFKTNSNYGLDIENHFYNDNNFMTELSVVGSFNINNFYDWGLREVVTTKQIFIDDYNIM